MRLTVWTVAALILGIAMPAHAQEEKSVDGNIGFGYSAVTGEARDHTGDAGVFEAGVTFNVSPTFGIQTNYNYTALGKEKTVLVNVSPVPGGPTNLEEFSADTHMHDVTFNAVWRAPAMGRVSPFVLFGPGVYHRTVNITTPAVGFTTVCDPWWYVCYPIAVPVDQVLGSRSSTDFGINFGAGVSFPLGDSASFYFDIRYIYIWGPTIDVPAIGTTPAQSVSANGQAIPIMFGFKF